MCKFANYNGPSPKDTAQGFCFEIALLNNKQGEEQGKIEN